MDDLHELNTIRAGVVLPGLQALITGILAGVTGAVAAQLAGWPVATGLLVGLAAALLSWLSSQGRWSGAVRYVLTGPDQVLELDEHSQVEEPVQAAPVIRLELTQDNTKQFIELPINPGQLAELVRGINAGKGLTVAGWVGIGKPFTRGQFESLRDVLISRNLARWVNGSKSSGCELTPAGRAVIRKLADSV